MLALVSAGAGYCLVPRSLQAHVPPGTAYVPLAYVPLAGGAVGAFDWQAVTRAGEVADGADPLAAALLAYLHEMRDRAAQDAPADPNGVASTGTDATSPQPL